MHKYHVKNKETGLEYTLNVPDEVYNWFDGRPEVENTIFFAGMLGQDTTLVMPANIAAVSASTSLDTRKDFPEDMKYIDTGEADAFWEVIAPGSAKDESIDYDPDNIETSHEHVGD